MRSIRQYVKERKEKDARRHRSHQSGQLAGHPVSESSLTSKQQQFVVALPSAAQHEPEGTSHSVAPNQIEKLGLRQIHIPVSASEDDEDMASRSLDIVAIHGITGSAYDTWTHANGTFWLRDLLPKDLPGVRIFSYGYPADVFCNHATGGINEFARSLLESLKRARRSKEHQKRPIIFVCHSMGGILVKQALNIAKFEENLYENIRTSVNGIMFLATPHRGSGSTQFISVLTRVANVALSGTSRFTGQLRIDLINALEKDSQGLKDISTRFKNQTSNFNIASLIEQDVTPPLKARVVDNISGVLDVADERYIPMPGCDHSSICRFPSKNSESYQTVLGVLQDWVEEINELSDTAMTAEDTSCLRSLGFPKITHRRQEADKAFLHTCEWILQHESYKVWAGTRRELLWIKGNPGSGKSTLMAYIHRELQVSHSSKRCVILDFFFHGRGTELQKTPIGMLRSLLYQIFDKVPLVRAPIQSMFREKQKLGDSGASWQWHEKELEGLFFDAVVRAAGSRSVVIFVDALDESGAENARALATYFHELNDKIAAEAGTTKICIACRHYPVAASKTSLNVVVEKENHADIAVYVRQTLRNGLPGPEMAILSPEEHDALEEHIITRASGIFMWARLMIPLIITLIQDGESLSFVNDTIERVPRGLGEVYMHILEKVIPRRNLDRTLLLLQWVCLAERPLSVTELRYAMASDDIQIDQEIQFGADPETFVDNDVRMRLQITSLSGGLVEVKKFGDQTTVQFIHQSVNDFLQSKGLKDLTLLLGTLQSKNLEDTSSEIVLGDSQNRLCRSCVDYLRLTEVVQLVSLLIPENDEHSIYLEPQERDNLLSEKLPFILYAVKHWLIHAEKAEGLGSLKTHLLQQLGYPQGSTLQIWVKILHHIHRYGRYLFSNGVTLLHVACHSNLHSIIQIMLDDNVDVNLRDGDNNTSLHYAAGAGHTDLSRVLLDAGAEIAARNSSSNTVINKAAASGHLQTLKLLLSRGADIEDPAGQSGGALYAAAEEGKYLVVQVLLDIGASVNAQGGIFRSALNVASSQGHEAVVKLLLDRGADINAQGGYYGSALQAASSHGHEAIVKLLLIKGANINARGGHYRSALQAASLGGYEAIVKLLLDKGADIHAQGGHHRSALQAASLRGYKTIVKLLLDKGADIHAHGGEYGSVLQAASWGEHVTIRQLYLNHGVNINARVGQHRSSLRATSWVGHEAVIQLLLDKGANINAQGGKYGSALQAAAYYGHEAIVQLLLDRGADINAQGGEYGSALEAASKYGHEAIVKLLLDKGAGQT